ncbi:hypothetical protein CQW23_22365 [Capsicum baccatum]|uniref:Protein TIME FOR COFFEE n=1 Tax=Capsicum baccatum TaxID=33114 RepID=A0A2G2W0N5_CAPBA|nr:hypothetical protein CQW23_22365 [Capsicum baccatum]
MDRNREARRTGGMVSASSNGLSRRRHRSNNSLRDSPDEEGGVEIQESVRLRERVKKDRDRERERERDRERDRETRDRDRDRSSRSKRRRGDRLMMHRGGGEDGGDDSSEESVNDDEEDEDDETTTTTTTTTNVVSSSTRLLPPAGPGTLPTTIGPSISNHHHHHHGNNHHNHHLQQSRKSFPTNNNVGGGKVYRAATAAAPVWKPGDEMIGVSVPRKARSAATKRSHDWISGSSGGGGGNNSGVVVTGDQLHQQVSTASPVGHNIPTTSPSPAAPLSPSSSNVSVRKKIKPHGQKRPPAKSPPKASSSNPEELEIEIAEVLFGLSHHGPSKKDPSVTNDNTREVNNNRSRVSSPVSNSNSSATPLSAAAPKRKRPRQVMENHGGFGIRSSPISAKVEMDQTTMKMEVSSPNLEKTPQSTAENGVSLYDLGASVQSLPVVTDPVPEPMKVESDVKRRPDESEFTMESKVEVNSPKKETSTVVAAESSIHEVAAAVAVTQVSGIVSEVESQREEKFQIDLMAPPPQLRSSPEREAQIDFGSAAVDNNKQHNTAENTVEMKPVVKEKDDERIGKAEKEEGRVSVEAEEKKTKAAVEEINSHKISEGSRGRSINLDLDLEKPEKDSGSQKLQQQQQQQQQQQPPPLQKATKDESVLEKTGQSSSLPTMPISMASWPSGLPPMGYMAPLQGVVGMDGSTVSSAAPMQPLFSQPRPKRCATHCYIARNIHCLQQFMKMHPFWPPAAGTAPFFGAKTNLNVMPSADLHGNLAGRGASAGPDKGQGLNIYPSNGGKDKVQPANMPDAAQRKQQMLLQQTLPPVAPNNLLHGPAFIFPLNQQQAAAAVRPGPAKSSSTTGPSVSSNTSNPAAGTSSATAGGAATAISFNYPNMSPNEAQYLAILQNNAYAFPIPAVGAPPNYRGTHPQPMPLFNGSFYSSQMIHPSQVQQQQPQQQQQPPTSQSQQMQQGQQNTSLSSGSSSSQKHLQNQQQRSQGNAVNGGSGGGGGGGGSSLHNFPGTKNHPSQSPAQSQNQHMPPQSRHIENEVGSEDSPSNAERKRSHGSMNVYNQNFAVPMHPSNFGLMTPPATFGVASSAGGGSNHHQTEKKPQQQQQQPGLKTSLESVPPQPFAMSFASFASPGPSIDMSMAQNHAIFQSLPEATRQNLQMAAAAAAQAVQQKKNFRISEDGKSGSGDQTGADAERKGLAMKPSGNASQSIAFSRSDISDASASTIAANSVIDSSSRSLNLPSGASWTARASMPNSMGAVNVPTAQLQAQIQQQHMIQLHKQQQQQQQQQQHQLAAAVAARSKTSTSSNGNVYSEHLTSSASAASKFPNAMSAFPQNLVQSGNNTSQAQSPQWKSSTRTSTPQAPSLSSTSSLKNLSQQQQVRSQQSHTQISFGTNQKSAPPQGQQPPNNNTQSPSPPMMVGSPTTSSISKGASGSPRPTNSTTTSNKTVQNSSLSTQQGKSSSSVPNQKSSPAGGRNVPSILGNPHIASTSGGGTKSQMQQQQQQQQQQQHLQKSMQQAQLFFSSPYVHAQPPHSSVTSSTGQATGGYYLQRRRPDQPGQQPPGSSAPPSSGGMLTLCPVTLGGGTTSDPAKAIAAAAAAANNIKGGVLPSQGILHASQYTTPTSVSQHQLLPAGFSYVHPVPAAVQVKPAEQKQPAGNDNLHACWQPEKK